MFDIGADEILLTALLAIVLIGPKEIPRALRLAGQWTGKFRRMSRAFHAGIETMILDAEVKEREQKWAVGQEEVLAQYAEMERVEQEKTTAQGLGEAHSGDPPPEPGQPTP